MTMESKIAKHLTAIPRSGIRDFFELVIGRDDIISLGVGEPDFITPWHIREAAIYSLEKGQTTYTSNLGLITLRESIAKYINNLFQLQYNPEKEILVTVGVSEALDLALRSLINPGDEVIYHEPSYVSYSPSIIMAHGSPIPIATKMEDNFSLKAKAIEKVLTPHSKILLLNFPTNPTGGLLQKQDLKEIAELCIKNDLIVITDEIYSELTYEEEVTSIASYPGMQERTILLHGFSKAFAMTGFRMGYACAPQALTEAMMKIHQYSMLCAPITSQVAAIEALENGAEPVIKMKKDYNMRREYMVRSLNDMGMSCHMPGGAFYVFPNIEKFGMTSVEFATALLEQKNVAAVPGSAFGSSGEGFLRCCYATSFPELQRAMSLLKEFVSEL